MVNIDIWSTERVIKKPSAASLTLATRLRFRDFFFMRIRLGKEDCEIFLVLGAR